jgi:putative membrane protein
LAAATPTIRRLSTNDSPTIRQQRKERTMSVLFAIVHHLAAFAVVAALAMELALLRAAPTAATVRRLVTADAVYGMAAAVLVAAGVARVFYFEKGADYYFHSLPFLLKMMAFALAGLLSIGPTRRFLGWRRALRLGLAPAVADRELRQLRAFVGAELIALAAAIVCAALAAKGIGRWG